MKHTLDTYRLLRHTFNRAPEDKTKGNPVFYLVKGYRLLKADNSTTTILHIFPSITKSINLKAFLKDLSKSMAAKFVLVKGSVCKNKSIVNDLLQGAMTSRLSTFGISTNKVVYVKGQINYLWSFNKTNTKLMSYYSHY